MCNEARPLGQPLLILQLPICNLLAVAAITRALRVAVGRRIAVANNSSVSVILAGVLASSDGREIATTATFCYYEMRICDMGTIVITEVPIFMAVFGINTGCRNICARIVVTVADVTSCQFETVIADTTFSL